MDLIAYIRVSSRGQADGYGLGVQEKACRSWARANGHRIVAVYSDVITGRTDAKDRPGLSAALDALRPPPQARGLVVPRLDRLARELHIQEAALAVAWKADAVVFTADDGEVLRDDPDDPMRTLLRQVVGAIAQFDKTSIAKRMRDGRVAKAEAGRKATGAYPYGWRGEGKGKDRDAVRDPDEQAALAKMLELRDKGASYREIAAALNADGIPTRRNAEGGWSPVAVRAIVLRETEKVPA